MLIDLRGTSTPETPVADWFHPMWYEPRGAEAEQFYDPAQSRDSRGRWSPSGGAGNFRIADGGKHLDDILIPRGQDSVNMTWNPKAGQISWGDRKGEWYGDYEMKPTDQIRAIDPDERHNYQDMNWPMAYQRTAHLGFLGNDTSPENAPGASKQALKYWSTEGNAYGKEHGGVPHQSLIQQGAERLLGMTPRPADSSRIFGKRSDEEYENMARGMLKSIHNGSPSQPTLWRGVSDDRVKGSNAPRLRAMKPGEEFDVPLMSTSRDANAASAYGDTMIRIAPGSKGYANRGYFEHDQEVITSGRFRVTRVDAAGDGSTVISVEQVGTWLPK